MRLIPPFPHRFGVPFAALVALLLMLAGPVARADPSESHRNRRNKLAQPTPEPALQQRHVDARAACDRAGYRAYWILFSPDSSDDRCWFTAIPRGNPNLPAGMTAVQSDDPGIAVYEMEVATGQVKRLASNKQLLELLQEHRFPPTPEEKPVSYPPNMYWLAHDPANDCLILGVDRAYFKSELQWNYGCLIKIDIATSELSMLRFDNKHDSNFMASPTGGYVAFNSSTPRAWHLATHDTDESGVEVPLEDRPMGGALFVVDTASGDLEIVDPAHRAGAGGSPTSTAWLPDGSGLLFFGATNLTETQLADPFAEAPLKMDPSGTGWMIWWADTGERELLQEDFAGMLGHSRDGDYLYLGGNRVVGRFNWKTRVLENVLALPPDSAETISFFAIEGDKLVYDVYDPALNAYVPKEVALPEAVAAATDAAAPSAP